MKIKQTIKIAMASLVVVLGFVVFATPAATYAATAATGNNGCETDTAIIKCTNSVTTGKGTSLQNTGLWGLLLIAINILTAGVGIAAVGGVIYGSVLYTSAGGSQEQVKKAMGIITNVVIGVIAYALMYAGLNFLIPGGVFN